MGVRPPQSGGDAETGPLEFGIAAVDAQLGDADIDFPASAATVRERLGDVEVPYEPGGGTVDLAEAVERTGREEFDSRQELLNALHPVFEELRASGGTGLLDWVRSLFD
jgi:hypothetical protein